MQTVCTLCSPKNFSCRNFVMDLVFVLENVNAE